MGFFDFFKAKHPVVNTKSAVNVEWVLKALDDIGTASKTSMGFAPPLPDEPTTTKYLRQDGTWEVPPDTTYSAGTGLSLSGTKFSLNIDIIYPIGSIYLSVNSSNPGTWLPGTTWIEWGSGRVPVGVNTNDTSFNTVEKTDGEKTHTLTVNEMPNHAHTYEKAYVSTSASRWADASRRGIEYEEKSTSYVGGNQSHNNLQPYITCYMWKRKS